MMAEERRKKVAELVSRRGFVSLTELAAELNASESTVRRDLEALDQSGTIRRTHGGAMAASDAAPVPAFEDRSRVSAAEKRSIGAVAARLVGDGETVLLDGGTTTFEVARQLLGRSVQVVTNSLPIAHLLAGDRRVDLTLVGGYVYPRTAVAVGPMAVQFLSSVHARRLIMSVAGVTERGFFNSNTLLVETQLQMMRAVDEVIVVADHTKFGQQSLAFLCPLNQVQRLVCDEGLIEEHRRMVGSAGVELIIAQRESA
ncbi:MAG: DeoR/GlpR transcriptional regulator [Planctomycetes bacterium]|nr:DeoR/GlpR transcriptional regulator [Planctomycetota bacterium]